MQTTSPLVDCGVHYVDVMCQVTDARPVRVQGIGLRLSDEIAEDMYNYGQLQVTFEDGSVGWYEAGWGPMMSETAFFREGHHQPERRRLDQRRRQGRVFGYRRAHQGGAACWFTAPSGDRMIDLPDEPGHQQLCDAEQAFVLDAIASDMDLTRHMEDAVRSLQICLAADESIRTGEPVTL